MKATSKNKIFLPAARDGHGNIRMAGHPTAMNIVFTALFLSADVYMLNIIPSSVLTEFNGPVAMLLFFVIGGSLYAIIRLWRFRVILTDQQVKFKDLNGSRTVKYEDIKKVGFIASPPSLYKQILIYDKIGQRYGIPFGGVGTNEITELFIRKCGLQRCMELNEKIESMKKTY